MKPIFKVGGHDYTRFLSNDGLKPSRNDIDSEKSGRNLLDGLMYRTRIAKKKKYTVSFDRLDEDTMSMLENDMDPEFVKITTLDPKEKRYIEREFYTATINEGIQRSVDGETTVYDGVTFNITER